MGTVVQTDGKSQAAAFAVARAAVLRGKVLIVDDQQASVRLLERMLRGAGYTSVSSTLDPYEVSELHRKNRYDLILLDLSMPGMDGFQVMQGLLGVETEGYLPVLVMTAEPAHRLRALKAGAKDFVSKPFDQVDVLTRISNMLEVRLLLKESRSYGQLLERTNESLRESRAQFETAFESLSEGLVVSALDGQLLHWNQAAVAMHGFDSVAEGLRRLPEFGEIFELQTVDGVVLPLDQWPLSRILRGEQLRGLEIGIRRLHQDWQRIFTYGGSLVRDEDGRAFLAVVSISDITERKRAEEEIRHLNAGLEQRVVERTAELEAANRDLEAFSYSVSHDLRAPLRAVDGFAQALLEDFGPQLPEEGQRQVRTIREGAQRMGVLIDDLLAFSQLGRQPLSKPVAVDMDRLVREALEELLPERQGRRVEIEAVPLPPTTGDRALLKQVWANLLSNAIKYTRKRDPAVVEIGSVPGPGETAYFVRDNGTGFDMRYAHNLFGVFQRLHRAEDFEGTGVGLAIVQRIVHRHGGRVWAEAAVDRGATFHFTLPRGAAP